MEIRGELLKPVEDWWTLLRTRWTYHSIKSKYKSIIAIRNIDGVCSINVSTTESLVWCPTHSHTYQCSCQPLMQFSVTARLQHLEGPKRRKREPSAQYLSIVFQLAFDYPFLLSSLLASYPGSFTQHGRGNEPGNEATPLSLSLSLAHPLFSPAPLLSFYNLGFTSSKSTRSNPWWTWKSSSRYTSTVRYKWASLRSFRRRYSRCLGVEFEWCASACMNWGCVWKCHLVSEVAPRIVIVQEVPLCILFHYYFFHFM